MKRIKQELLEKDFVVNTPSEEKMHEVVGLLCDSKLSLYDFDRYGKETCIKYLPKYKDCRYADKECYESRGNTILNYDDIFEDCEVSDAKFDGGLTFESNITMSFERNCNNVMGIHGLMKSLEGYNNDVLFENGSIISIIDTDGSLLTKGKVKYAENEMVMLDLLGLNKEEEEMSKIENRIEELEESIWKNELKLEELKVANKYSDMSMEISSQLSLIDKEKKLLKGYETLDNMEIGNVIINNGTVIVISLYGKKAISKLSEGDSFNFLAGFFLCLTKLGSTIDTDWYDYSIHAALEDIELGNL